MKTINEKDYESLKIKILKENNDNLIKENELLKSKIEKMKNVIKELSQKFDNELAIKEKKSLFVNKNK